ncbi:MAG: NAD(P)-dependent oxidoreductase [Oscillospiraceae bacterium]|nr:NAD(P)-dependent oxidoreductase [Oscillospiraceae bacterium]
MFTDIENKKVLICGGGFDAEEKIERLLPFSPSIRIVAQNISCNIKALSGITMAERCFCESDLAPRPIFVIAAEDRMKNEIIVSACKKRNIPVNAVDMPDLCDFIFPAMIKSKNLCVAVNTNVYRLLPGLR